MTVTTPTTTEYYITVPIVCHATITVNRTSGLTDDQVLDSLTESEIDLFDGPTREAVLSMTVDAIKRHRDEIFIES